MARSIAACLMCLLAALPVRADDPDPYVEQLRAYGIQAETGSITAYLRSIRPDADRAARVMRLIERLGDDSFQQRQQAHRMLVVMPDVPLELLGKGVRDRDPEVRWRCRQILEVAQRDRTGVLHAALRTIDTHRLTGAAPEVLDVLEILDPNSAGSAIEQSGYLREAARKALRATATRDDATRLRKALASGMPSVRIAACESLAAAVGKPAVADVRPLAGDKDDTVRVVAARALLDMGERDALTILGKLLDSDELPVRQQAGTILRAATGKNFAFTAYESDAEKRTAAADRWREWIAQNGPTAKLNIPLPAGGLKFGRILVCNYRTGRVDEFDVHGKPTGWSVAVANPWGCQGLSNGNRLVSSYQQRFVVEYNDAGKEVWRLNNLPGMPFSVRRLENGNTLVACYNSNQVLEYAAGAKTGDNPVRTIQAGQNPCDARRLPNGNTLVTLLAGRQVVEYDQDDKVVWSAGGLLYPRSAQPLENGNVLVSDYQGNRIVEFKRDGEKGVEIWVAPISRPYHAQRLENGDTLVVNNAGLYRISPDKTSKMIVGGGGGGGRIVGGFSSVSMY